MGSPRRPFHANFIYAAHSAVTSLEANANRLSDHGGAPQPGPPAPGERGLRRRIAPGSFRSRVADAEPRCVVAGAHPAPVLHLDPGPAAEPDEAQGPEDRKSVV